MDIHILFSAFRVYILLQLLNQESSFSTGSRFQTVSAVLTDGFILLVFLLCCVGPSLPALPGLILHLKIILLRAAFSFFTFGKKTLPHLLDLSIEITFKWLIHVKHHNRLLLYDQYECFSLSIYYSLLHFSCKNKPADDLELTLRWNTQYIHIIQSYKFKLHTTDYFTENEH